MITDQKEYYSETSSRNGVLFQNFYSRLNLEFVSERLGFVYFPFISNTIFFFVFICYLYCEC